MKCIYHMDRQAVGVCAFCGRGMCEECAVDVQEHAVCAGHCEEPMRHRLALEKQNRRMNSRLEHHLTLSRKLHRISGIAWIITGLLLVIISWSFEPIPLLLLAFLPGLVLSAAGLTQVMLLQKKAAPPGSKTTSGK